VWSARTNSTSTRFPGSWSRATSFRCLLILDYSVLLFK
jgi:hypothetical protein